MALAHLAGEDVSQAKQKLDATRPTAVNLVLRTTQMMQFFTNTKPSGSEMMKKAQKIAEEEREFCKKMAELGSSLIPSKPKPGHANVNIIHHCNTGALATLGLGTALGVVTRRHQIDSNIHVYVNETRPRLQGSRLTSWELTKSGIPHHVMADSAAGYVLFSGNADVVIFGADRIAANGDVVNKIGTYALSVVAHENGVPVICVAPTSTIDLHMANGKSVEIEEREGEEVLNFGGVRVASPNAQAFNPAFDITPFRFITAIVTEEGVCRPPFMESLAHAKARAVETANKNKRPVKSTFMTDGSDDFKPIERSTKVETFPEPIRHYVPQKTSLGDGTEANYKPKTSVAIHSKAKATYMGDGSADSAAMPPPAQVHTNVRVYAHKSSILLTDEAQPAQEFKASIRTHQPQRQTRINDDETSPWNDKPSEKKGHHGSATTSASILGSAVKDPITNSSPPRSKGRGVAVQQETSLGGSVMPPRSTARGHFETPSAPPPATVLSKAKIQAPIGQHDHVPTAKAHVEAEASGFESSPISKAHVPVPAPHEAIPTQRAHMHASSAPSTPTKTKYQNAIDEDHPLGKSNLGFSPGERHVKEKSHIVAPGDSLMFG